MGRFSKVKTSTLSELQTDAGVLLRNFDPSVGMFEDEDIITATTGGINPSCIPTYSDYYEDIDNAPNNTKEGKHLDGWECTLGFTALGTSAETIRLALGAADVNEEIGAIVPRASLKNEDFSDVWWVGDRSDGGMVAIRLINALSTSGFSLQTTKNGKGQISVTLTGHVSIETQEIVPMEVYVQEGTKQ